jgi:hypothetical protein
MEVQVRVEVLLVKNFDLTRVRRVDMAVPHVLSHHRSILGFHQPVVIVMPRPRFGLLDQQFVQQLGHSVINELATVIRKASRV